VGPAIWTFAFINLTTQGAPIGVSYQGGHVSFIDSNFGAAPGGTPFQNKNSGGYFYAENVVGVTAPNAAKFQGTGYENGALVSPGAIAERRAIPLAPSPSRPKINDTSIVNVHDLGAHGDGSSDDSAVLQQAINQYRTVFLPGGTYLISNTLQLRSVSRLFGEGGTRIVLAANAPGFGDPNNPKAVILAPDDPAASVVLGEFWLTNGAGDSGAVLIDWGAGSGSGIWDVYDSPQGNPAKYTLRFFGHGGGVVSNMMGSGPSTQAEGFYGGSTGPAWFYGAMFEHYSSIALHLNGARNYVFVEPETEDAPTAIRIENSQEISLYSVLGTMSGTATQLLDIRTSNKVYAQELWFKGLSNMCLTMAAADGSCTSTMTGNGANNWTEVSLLRFF
jgi:hypothetical protein